MEAETRARLHRSKQTLAEIAQASGLSLSWLGKFSADQRGDYGVRLVEQLNSYLRFGKPVAAPQTDTSAIL